MANTQSSNLITIERPAPPAIVQEMAPVVAQAKAFSVLDVPSHAEALERIKRLRNGERAITDYFEPARKAADAAKKEILLARDGLIAPITEARTIYDRTAQTYEQEERRKADVKARELQAQARKQEEERQLQAAIDAEASGDTQAAEAILAETPSVPVVTVAPAVAQVEGVSSRTLWSAEVHDLHELVKYVAAHPEWITLIEPCRPNLNRLATAQRSAMAIPGVRAVSRESRTTKS